MDKIDRLGWADGLSFTSYGVRVGVRVNDPKALNRLPEHLPPGWKPAPPAIVERLYSLVIGNVQPHARVRQFNLLYANADQLMRTMDVEEVYERFESDLKLYVAEAARQRIFLHAGVVGWRGSAIVIPGRSFSGKTTLVAELVRAGATYYSDEYAVLDARGRVHPYPRPLAIRQGLVGNQKKCSVEELGGRSGVKSLRVGLVIVTK